MSPMKNLTVIAALLGAFLPLLPAAEFARMEFPDAQSINAFPIWQNKSKIEREYAPGVVPPDSQLKGSVKFICQTGGNHPAESTPVFPVGKEVFQKNAYSLMVQLMSPKRLEFPMLVMRDAPPWSKLAGTQVVTEPGQWQTVKLDFTAQFDVKGVRAPAFFLGGLHPGDVLYVASMRFDGPDPDQLILPLFSAGSEPVMRNIGKKRDWSYASAWKRQFGQRERVSLCGLWDFAPSLESDGAMPAPGSEEWAHLLVPAHWRGGNVTNFIHLPDGRPVTAFKGCQVGKLRNGWYRRTIDVPSSWRGRRVRLEFTRIDMTADIFVNGRRVGGTEDFQQPLRNCLLDVTDAVKFGEANEIALRVGTPGDLSLERSGIAGYVYLESLPKENFGFPSVTTAVSARQFKLAFRDSSIDGGGMLKLVIRDFASGEAVHQMQAPFAEALAFDYVTPKLWSPESPNLYWLEMTLERGGKVIDAHRVRFGSSELRVVGPDYLLNGRKINIFADTGVDDGGYWSVDWKHSPEYVRRELRALKAMNLNAAYFGQLMPPELLDVYDEEGVLAIGAAGIPYERMSELTESEAEACFRDRIAGIKASGRFDNHPSHAGFQVDVWYNFHPGTTNPEFVGLKHGVKSHLAFDKDGRVVTREGGDPNLDGDGGMRKRKLDKVAALFRHAFPGKVVFTGGSGEVGDVYATHAYHTWGAPFEEMRAFFRRYSLQRELPIFVGEHNIPYIGSLYEIFAFTAGGANALSLENFARYAGNDGYRWRAIYGRRALHDMGPESIQDSRTDQDRDGRYHINSDLLSILLDKSLNTMIPGWRLSGANGIGFFCYAIGQHYALAGCSVDRYREVPDELSQPAFHPEYLPGGANPTMVPVYEKPFFLKPTLASPAFRRVTAPLLAEFIEDREDEYGLDHAWFGGDTLRKRLFVVNDGAEALRLDCRITLRGEGGATLASHQCELQLGPGDRAEVPFEFAVPEVGGRINGRLHAEVVDGGHRATTSLDVQLFPRVAVPHLRHGLHVYDPEGSVAGFLRDHGVAFTALSTLDGLPSSGVLVIGRGALSRSSTVPDFNQLASRGVSSLILEQNSSAGAELMKVRTRHAFINAGGHPALRGFEDRDFANWRGNVSLVDAYGISGPRKGWSEAGNRNMLASYVFRRPSHGNYLSLLVSGFDCYQSPLLEYRAAAGSWIGSQLELAPRLGVDPVATTLFVRLLGYLDTCGFAAGQTLFYGGEEGRRMLDRLAVEYRQTDRLDAETLAGARTLLILAPDFGELKKSSMALMDFVHDGGRVIYLHAGGDFESVWLPFPMRMEKARSRQALANTAAADNWWRCGFDNNDLYWHDEFEVPSFAGIPEQARAFDPAVLVDFPVGAGTYTLLSVRPEDFQDKPATGKTCRLISALLTNAGVKIRNESLAYLTRNGQTDCLVDLAESAWSFALDPQDTGLQGQVEQGKDGGLKWLTGLIADGCEVKLGVHFEQFLRQQYDGYVWYRLELELPEALQNCETLYLSFGAIDDFDWCYFNGELVGQTTDKESTNYWLAPRLYAFPGSLARPGRNLVVVRVRDLRGEGGIYQLPAALGNVPAVSGTRRGWQTPYEKGTARDYEYAPDPVRQY